MTAFLSDTSTPNSGRNLDFQVRRWHLEWWIFPEAKTLSGIAERSDLLVPRTLPIGSPPINWSFLDWPEATRLNLFGLSSRFREELKTTLRKRSDFKGNTKHLFFQHGELPIPFETFVIPYSDQSLAIYLRTPSMALPLSSSELASLSAHPSLSASQVRMAIQKICAVLKDGNINSRNSGSIKYRWYPYIQIIEYDPKSHEGVDALDIPWHELVPIGTRHTNISSSDQGLINSYKAKNHSIRGGVLVVDKQSTLVVSAEDYLELHGIRFCLAVALRMRQLLEREFRATHETIPIAKSLLERLRFAYERPSVITDSQHYRMLWPLIAKECQAIEWLTNVEQKSTVVPPNSPKVKSLSSARTISDLPEQSSAISNHSAKAIEWLHLSDFHFKASGNQTRERVLNALRKDLSLTLDNGDWSPDFVAVTGDITFSAKSEEFKRSWDFMQQILKTCGLKKDVLFVVPGNHDVNRGAHQPTLFRGLRDARSAEEYDKVCEELGDQHVLGLFTRRLTEYFEFLKYLPRRRRLSENKLWFVDKVVGKGGGTAAIAGLTSSWASGEDREDERRFLAIGDFQARPAMDALRKMDADIRIVLMHHPLEALQRQDERAFDRALRGVCDILLRGHLHETNLKLTADPDWGFATLAAGSAYETQWSKNGYLLARATIMDSQIELKVKARKWAQDGEFFGADTSTYFQGRNDGVFALKFSHPLEV